jgi:gas vesicle protein
MFAPCHRKDGNRLNNFLKLLLGTGLYLLEQSDQSTRKIRDRAAENLSDLRDLAQEKYETAADRVSKASRAIRGEDNQGVSNALSLAAGIGVGLALGVIFAPASGEQTRSAIANRVHVFGDRIRQQFSSEDLGPTGTNG